MEVFISFIIPIYNGEKTLSHCLDSILSVQAEGMELILVNDGSSDRSLEVMQDYSCRFPFVHIISQNNRGPSAARNQGLLLATGQYVAFFDCDDYIDPAVFKKLLCQMEKRERNTDVWVSDFLMVRENGAVQDSVFQIGETENPIRDPEYLVTFFHAQKAYWNVWRCVFRREFLLEKKICFLEGCHCAEDMEFMTRVFLADGVYAFFHTPYYHYVVKNTGTLSRNNSLERLEHVLGMIAVSMTQLLEQRDRPYAKPMLDKLALEFLLNLPMCRELPKPDQKKAERVYLSHMDLLMRSDNLIYHLIYQLIRIFGISAVSCAAFQLKKCKQFGKRVRWMFHSIGASHGIAV